MLTFIAVMVAFGAGIVLGAVLLAIKIVKDMVRYL